MARAEVPETYASRAALFGACCTLRFFGWRGVCVSTGTARDAVRRLVDKGALRLVEAGHVVELRLPEQILEALPDKAAGTACVDCNSKKGEMRAEDFLLLLHRQRRLSSSQLDGRLRALEALDAGELQPPLPVQRSKEPQTVIKAAAGNPLCRKPHPRFRAENRGAFSRSGQAKMNNSFGCAGPFKI